MKPNLIVFYSRTGKSRIVASELNRVIDADCEDINISFQRHGLISYLSSGWSALTRTPVQINPPQYRARPYPLVIIGGPNWAGHVCAPLLSWLDQEGTELGRYAVWVTQGGVGASRTIRQLEDEIGHPPAATLVLSNAEIDNGNYRSKLGEFAAELAELNLQ
ncbi:MAG: hypothetical protein R3256_12845 [Thalassovita sp.]|nr:hypothetical protein [Thalassovita sp.]